MFDAERKFRFRKFPVYLAAKSLTIAIRSAVKTRFPAEERFALGSQAVRAADSVVLNVAEGSERSSDVDFARFLVMAHASLNEVVACLDIAVDCAYLPREKRDELVSFGASISDQLTSFRRSLLSTRARSTVQGQRSSKGS